MKKVIGIIAVIVISIAVQSCGAGEKCPAYSQAPAQEVSVRS